MNSRRDAVPLRQRPPARERFETWLGQPDEARFFLYLTLLATVLTAAVAATLTILIERDFMPIACDTAVFENALVNTLHGHWFRETVYQGPNLLGLHSTFILLALAPVYVLFPAPETFFIIQVCAVYAAAPAVYLVATEYRVRPVQAFLFALLALASPLLFHMAMAPFHPETWIATALLWALYAYRRHRPAGFALACIVAVTSGEQAAFMLVSLGLVLLWVEDGLAWRRRYGWAAFLGGLGWLLFFLGFVQPFMHRPEQDNLFATKYTDWHAGSAIELARAVLADPLAAVLFLLDPARWMHLALLVGVPLLLAFARRSVLWLAPLPVYFLMDNQEFSLYFHAYYFAFAFLAGTMGLITFFSDSTPAPRTGLLILVLAAVAQVMVLGNALATYGGFSSPDTALNLTLREVFATLPTEAGIYGPHRYSAWLAGRDHYAMGDIREPGFDPDAWLTQHLPTTDIAPAQIDYLVCDLINDQCGWRSGGYKPEWTQARSANVQRLLDSGRWKIYWQQERLLILQRVL